ncbi:hypothetical protein SNEBB_008056 [Seison nebaliae]|nr:hypothetical protein SNEBB_008056 [Seison nebaliae]
MGGEVSKLKTPDELTSKMTGTNWFANSTLRLDTQADGNKMLHDINTNYISYTESNSAFYVPKYAIIAAFLRANYSNEQINDIEKIRNLPALSKKLDKYLTQYYPTGINPIDVANAISLVQMEQNNVPKFINLAGGTFGEFFPPCDFFMAGVSEGLPLGLELGPLNPPRSLQNAFIHFFSVAYHMRELPTMSNDLKEIYNALHFVEPVEGKLFEMSPESMSVTVAHNSYLTKLGSFGIDFYAELDKAYKLLGKSDINEMEVTVTDGCRQCLNLYPDSKLKTETLTIVNLEFGEINDKNFPRLPESPKYCVPLVNYNNKRMTNESEPQSMGWLNAWSAVCDTNIGISPSGKECPDCNEKCQPYRLISKLPYYLLITVPRLRTTLVNRYNLLFDEYINLAAIMHPDCYVDKTDEKYHREHYKRQQYQLISIITHYGHSKLDSTYKCYHRVFETKAAHKNLWVLCDCHRAKFVSIGQVLSMKQNVMCLLYKNVLDLDVFNDPDATLNNRFDDTRDESPTRRLSGQSTSSTESTDESTTSLTEETVESAGKPTSPPPYDTSLFSSDVQPTSDRMPGHLNRTNYSARKNDIVRRQLCVSASPLRHKRNPQVPAPSQQRPKDSESPFTPRRQTPDPNQTRQGKPMFPNAPQPPPNNQGVPPFSYQYRQQ